MISLDMPIIVEGKYDKIKLSSIVDSTIITTEGFGIFKNKDRVQLIKKLAEKKGVIVLTDSDSAGSIIRSYLKNIIGEEKIYNVFLPEIKGKERRKITPSAEGLLGVEGVDKEIILSALKRFLPDNKFQPKEPITKAFLMQCGLSGCENSSQLRKEVLKKLNIPNSVAPNTLLRVLNDISSREEILKIIKEINEG
ncbi:MAG: DUF4093 domain-containing protein [Clostridia bacterium]|nr:DUF4093 domain-containing protein [Clostridia bacterium]